MTETVNDVMIAAGADPTSATDSMPFEQYKEYIKLWLLEQGANYEERQVFQLVY
jgi:hypothetical protein